MHALFLGREFSFRRAGGEGLEHGPRGEEVDWDAEIFEGWVSEEQAEDVEHVVPIIGQGERVDEGVVVHYCIHEAENRESGEEARCALFGSWELYGGWQEGDGWREEVEDVRV